MITAVFYESALGRSVLTWGHARQFLKLSIEGREVAEPRFESYGCDWEFRVTQSSLGVFDSKASRVSEPCFTSQFMKKLGEGNFFGFSALTFTSRFLWSGH